MYMCSKYLDQQEDPLGHDKVNKINVNQTRMWNRGVR